MLRAIGSDLVFRQRILVRIRVLFRRVIQQLRLLARLQELVFVFDVFFQQVVVLIGEVVEIRVVHRRLQHLALLFGRRGEVLAEPLEGGEFTTEVFIRNQPVVHVHGFLRRGLVLRLQRAYHHFCRGDAARRDVVRIEAPDVDERVARMHFDHVIDARRPIGLQRSERRMPSRLPQAEDDHVSQRADLRVRFLDKAVVVKLRGDEAAVHEARVEFAPVGGEILDDDKPSIGLQRVFDAVNKRPAARLGGPPVNHVVERRDERDIHLLGDFRVRRL